MRFHRAPGYEPRGRLNFTSADDLYLGLPGDGGAFVTPQDAED